MSDEPEILIYIVDDDPSVRKALRMLFKSADIEVETFKAAEDFLGCQVREQNACLVCDIELRGLSGLDLLKLLLERGIKIPVIFITASDSSETRQQAKNDGAVAYFRKPIDDQALLDSIYWAISNHSHT